MRQISLLYLVGIVIVLMWGLAPLFGIDAYTRYVWKMKDAPHLSAFKPFLKHDNVPSDEQVWRERLMKEAPALRIKPIDARIDPVWKAIPGYNGREVDQEATLKLIASRKLAVGSAIPYIYRDIPPNQSLEDLGAQPIFKGNPEKPMVSLMINVAWGDEFLPSMLSTLNKENVHATFFFDGTWLSKHIETARQIGAYGHELSNHAYSHKNMSRLNRDQAAAEIVKTEKLLTDKLGVHNTLFAPPSGDFDQETVDIAHQLHLKTVLWTLDTVDWKNPAPETIIRRISKGLEPGALILMHPTSSSSQALPALIREIKRKGLAIGTVSELLSPSRISPDGQGVTLLSR